MHSPHQHAQVMAEHLAKRFIDPPYVTLVPKAIPELALHHRVSNFDFGPLVVVLQELLAVVGEVHRPRACAGFC